MGRDIPAILPIAIICDIDGTIALRGNRGPHDHDSSMEDAVNWPVVQIINQFMLYEYRMILVSGRDEQYRDVTEYWLRAHALFPHKPDALLMRPRGDNRADEIVKREIYERQIKGKYSVRAVFDDRNKVVKMWRELGLLCLQVAEGDF